MGMFDWVNYPEENCPEIDCKGKVNGWQSKDAQCMLDTVQPEMVDYFYASCDTCGKWIEYEVTGVEIHYDISKMKIIRVVD
jgi:hypothetical protein